MSLADLEKIDRHISRASVPASKPDALRLQREWAKWYGELGWFDKSLSIAALHEARTRFAKFAASMGTAAWSVYFR